MRRLAAPGLAVWLCACGADASPEPTHGFQRAEARRAAESIADRLDAGEAQPACGSAVVGPPGGTVAMVNARQALSCRDLGYMLRRIRSGVAGRGPLTIVIPARDTAAVCPYLREERIRLPAVAVRDDEGILAGTRTLTLYTARPGQRVDSVFYAVTGTGLLDAVVGPAFSTGEADATAEG